MAEACWILLSSKRWFVHNQANIDENLQNNQFAMRYSSQMKLPDVLLALVTKDRDGNLLQYRCRLSREGLISFIPSDSPVPFPPLPIEELERILLQKGFTPYKGLPPYATINDIKNNFYPSGNASAYSGKAAPIKKEGTTASQPSFRPYDGNPSLVSSHDRSAQESGSPRHKSAYDGVERPVDF